MQQRGDPTVYFALKSTSLTDVNIQNFAYPQDYNSVRRVILKYIQTLKQLEVDQRALIQLAGQEQTFSRVDSGLGEVQLFCEKDPLTRKTVEAKFLRRSIESLYQTAHLLTQLDRCCLNTEKGTGLFILNDHLLLQDGKVRAAL